MLQRLFKKRSDQTVMGYRLEEPRITFVALVWVVLYVGLPVAGLGLLIDFFIEWTTGRCLGLWCYF